MDALKPAAGVMCQVDDGDPTYDKAYETFTFHLMLATMKKYVVHVLWGILEGIRQI